MSKAIEISLPEKRSVSMFMPKFVKVTGVLMASIVSVYLISRYVLADQSLRLDEAQSLWQSSHSLGGLLSVVARDVHVPLYHVLLHFWMFYLGDSIESVRMLSVLLFTITIPVIYLLARQLLSRNWSLFATVLFSLSPFLNWYGNEARMYTLLLLFSALNQLFFMRILKYGKGWFWFGLTAVIGAYTHYFFLFNLLAMGLFYLFNRKKFSRFSFTRFIVVASLVVAVLIPWLYYVYTMGSASSTRPMLPVPSSVDFFNVFSQFLFGFQSNYVNTIVLSAWPTVMLVALVAVRRSKGVKSEVSFMATMSVLPIILAFIVSVAITPFFLSRYMVVAIAPLLIVIVYLVSKYSRNVALLVCSILVLTVGFTSYLQATSAATPVKENYKGMTEDINSHVQPQDLVVLSAPFILYPFEYYYKGSAQIATLPVWDRTQAGNIPGFNENSLATDVESLHKNHRYIYLVLGQDQGYEDTISNYYLNNFRQVSKKEYSPGLTLFVYQVGYYTVPPLEQSPAVQE